MIQVIFGCSYRIVLNIAMVPKNIYCVKALLWTVTSFFSSHDLILVLIVLWTPKYQNFRILWTFVIHQNITIYLFLQSKFKPKGMNNIRWKLFSFSGYLQFIKTYSYKNGNNTKFLFESDNSTSHYNKCLYFYKSAWR